ncbi:MAG: phosphoribosylformylglycinamidine synthase subunit PurQ [Thermoplasmata archaeon]
MNVADVKVCVLRIEGTNCEQEMAECFRRCGAQAEIVHLKQLTGECAPQKKRSLSDYHILMLPGGFSSGDYVRAGAIFAARMKNALMKELVEFVEKGYAVGGICNGFQVLVELGLLPGIDKTYSDVPEIALGINDSARFECRPTYVKCENSGKCVFTRNIRKGRNLLIPSAHAEGKLILPENRAEEMLQQMIEQDQIVFRYVDYMGNYAGYPWNPNGSIYNIAGICNSIGNVFGMMPHPERVFYRIQHPDWTQTDIGENVGDGRGVFESVLSYITRKF